MPPRKARLLPARASRSGSSSSATTSNRCAPTIPGTQRSIEPIDQAQSSRCRSCSTTPTARDGRRDRSATFLDYLADAQADRARVRAGRSQSATFVKQREQIEASYAEAVAQEPEACRSPRRSSSAGTTWRRRSRRRPRSRRWRSGRRTRSATSPRSRRWSSPAAFPTGSPSCAPRAQAGETVVFVAHSQGRAERVVEMLADYQVPAAPIDRGEDAHAAPCSSRSATCRRASACPDAGLQLWAETDVFDEERHTHEKRRSAAQDVPVGLPRPEDRRPRRPRRQRHRRLRRPEEDRGRPRRRRSSWSSATPAKTSSSSRSSGSISSRSTPARRAPRSTSWAGRPGRRRRRASRRRCATWRRSCSSSTPRARPFPATRSAPTATGSRSSRTRSSGT